jgi:glycerophosphoryl diester phosphodiesterase
MRLLRDRERDRPLLVCSQNWSQLERFRTHPDVSLVHSIGNRRQLSRAWQRLETDDHDAVSIHVRLLTAETVRALKERVSMVVTWPINDQSTAQRVLGWGVDGLTTDVPARILPLDTSR